MNVGGMAHYQEKVECGDFHAGCLSLELEACLKES